MFKTNFVANKSGFEMTVSIERNQFNLLQRIDKTDTLIKTNLLKWYSVRTKTNDIQSNCIPFITKENKFPILEFLILCCKVGF